MWGYALDLLMYTPNEWSSDSNYSQICMAFNISDTEPTPFCYLYTDEYRQALDTMYRWNQNGWISAIAYPTLILIEEYDQRKNCCNVR